MPVGPTNMQTGLVDRALRVVSRVGSKFARGADAPPTELAMQGHLRAQKLAYETVVHVSKQLTVGMSEQAAAELLADYLASRGAERYLHRPFAWFGDHSRFDGYRNFEDFHPSSRTLRADDVAILDVSPIVDGYIGDVGYAVSLAPDPRLVEAREFLLRLRDAIPRLFASERTPAQIWAEVDEMILGAGYDNVHAKYPFGVLGHRVFRVKPKSGKSRRIGTNTVGWFSLETNLAFLKFGPSAALTADHVGSKVGLWAIEPHIGWDGAGSKFEEILVVEPSGAYWLDDDVPHVTDPFPR